MTAWRLRISDVNKHNDSRRALSAMRHIVCLLPFFRKRRLVRAAFCNERINLPIACFLLGMALVCSAQTPAYDSAPEYPIKVAFLYKFCLYVEWPKTAFDNTESPIILGVAGPDTVADELSAAVKEHTINNRRLEVHRIGKNSDLTDIHLLFVARSEASMLHDFAAKSQNIPLLLVSEVNDGLDEGAGINFIVRDNKVRFDVALDTTNKQGLHLSAQLLKVARNVRGENSP
jgi:hypothetical protein